MMLQVQRQPSQSIALCLSGGGLRATLFHLGVLRALRAYTLDGKMALTCVSEVFAVSGGSILAGHFLRNYSSYVGSDEEFETAAKEVFALSARDIRNRVLRRWALTWWMGKSRGHWLQREYKTFLADAKISTCYKAEGLPIFHFLATNFNNGELCSFSGKQFEKIRRTDAGYETDRTAAGNIRLAYAVAASSSFPPMFPPIGLTPDMLGRPEDPEFADSIELSDGGIYDNFGIDKFRMASRDGPVPAHLIVSHAGGSFDTARDKSYGSMLSRNIRASDILMRRVGDATLQSGQIAGGEGFALIRIGDVHDDGTLEVSTQQLLRLVRTDLDRFGPELTKLLVDHGCRVACKVLDNQAWARAARPEIIPETGRDDALAEVARKASHRSIKPLFFGFRDAGVLILWWLIGLAAVAALGYGMISYMSATAEERKVVLRRQAAFNTIEKQLDSVRKAAKSGNIEQIRKVLAIAITTTQELGNDPDLGTAPAAKPFSAAKVDQIIAGPQPLPTLRPTQHRQRVFIQFAGVLTRAQITAVNQEMKRAGWSTQGGSGERTAAAAGLNQVRYSGDNLQAAADLADALNKSGLPGATVVPKALPAIGGNDLEVWMSR